MIINNDNCSVDAIRDPLTGAPGEHPAGIGIGAVVGGQAGEGAFRGRDNVENGASFDHSGPAYHFGVHARGRYPGRDFDDVESEMASDWAASRGVSILSWEWAKHAARDAWNRISPSSGLCT